ncbi:hypothetical protein GLOIN_2v1485513 [Rhizophagus irregularis DAOM 181602=DAOM 197198]|nr:hypothetical protein GLOIN_2v1485513 [Rhizophagus irregularis DAOM 181602=DAOM 197198]
MYKLVAYKEELKNLTDKDIIDFYGGYDWFFGKTIYIKNKRIGEIYEKDVEEITAGITEEYVKEKDVLKKGIQQSAERIIKAMGWSLNELKKKKAELPVTEEDMNLYDQVNRNCSSPEIKKEEISEEKIRQKRSSKEEISRVKVIGEYILYGEMLISATTCTQLNSDSSERIERKRDKEVDKDKVVEPEAVMLNENKKRVVTSQGSRIDE